LTFPQKKVLAKRGSGSSGHVEITLGKIKTALSSGHANLYVRYEGIPGYQDGQFILTVEKSPLVFDKKGNMAVGKLVQTANRPKFDVAGSVVADQLSVSRDNATRGGLYFAGAGDLNHAIYNNLSNLDGEGEWDGAKWNTFKGLSIRVGNRSAKPPTLRSALLISGKGNVGIGTGTGLPEAKLEIALDDVDTRTNSLAVRKGTTNYLTIGNDGNVGIGAPTPAKKLDVYYGELQVTASHNNPTADIGAFYAENKTQGIGIGYNQIAAIGTDSSQDILITPKGQGIVHVKGSLTVNSSLQATASHNHSNLNNPDAADIGAFYAKDKIQGIGISSNRISAIGTSSDSRHYQNIFIKPKGMGSVVIEGPLHGANGALEVNGAFRVNGLPIFDYGMRMTQGQYKAAAEMLKGPSYFIFVIREDASDDICCLVKKSNNEVQLLQLWLTGKERM
jgi:hypothetical protein